MSVVALILSIGGNILLNFKKVKLGYAVWVISNLMWVIIGLTAAERNYPQIMMYVIYTMLNIHGIYKWGKSE